MIRIIKTMGLCMLFITALGSITKLYAQEKQVTGTVISSENKQPATGVTILVKGTRTATTSDAQGHYKITIDNKAILIFSSTSFISQEITIGDKSVIDVELVPDIKSIGDVVVIGY